MWKNFAIYLKMETNLDQQEYDEDTIEWPPKEKPVYVWTEITKEFFESIQELQLVNIYL